MFVSGTTAGITVTGGATGTTLNPGVPYGATVGGAGTSAGSELDLILSYKHSENVSFEVNAARFFVGQALQNGGVIAGNAAGTPTSPISRLGADVKIKF